MTEVLEGAATLTAEAAAGDGQVQIAYLHEHVVSHSWHECMTRLMLWDLSHNKRTVNTAGPFMLRAYTGDIAGARNLVAQQFLDQTPHEWLWFIDTDMGFHPDVIDMLLAAADPVERPIVGALCFALRETRNDGSGGRRVMPIPTIYVMGRQEDGMVGFTPRMDYPRDTIVQAAGTGAACLLIHRSVFERMREQFGDQWFTHVRYENGDTVSEDLSFCYRAGMLEIPIFVHTGVKTTHHKQVWIGEDDYTEPTPLGDLERQGLFDHLPEGVKVVTYDDDLEVAA